MSYEPLPPSTEKQKPLPCKLCGKAPVGVNANSMIACTHRQYTVSVYTETDDLAIAVWNKLNAI